MDRDPLLAKSCLHIFVYQQVNWRICHRNSGQLLVLKNVLSFGVLKGVPGIEIGSLMSK